MSNSLSSRAAAPVSADHSAPLLHNLPLVPDSRSPGVASTWQETPVVTPCVDYLTLFVTPGDFYWSERSGLSNPILCALQRHTGTLWRLYEDGFALEAMAPYRACQLPHEMVQQWRAWQVTGQLETLQWNLELVATQQCDNYSLIQRRHTNLREKAALQSPEKGASLA